MGRRRGGEDDLEQAGGGAGGTGAGDPVARLAEVAGRAGRNRHPRLLPLLRILIALLMLTATVKVGTHEGPLGPPPAVAAAGTLPPSTALPPPPATTTVPTTTAPVNVPATAPPAPPTTTAATTTTPPPPLPSTAAPAPAPAPLVTGAQPTPVTAEEIGPYRGLGTWVDVYDWSNTYTNGRPTTSPDDLDRMAEAGVQTLYIQASKHDAPSDVLEPELLQAYIDRAGARGVNVVVWYLPTLVDVGRDLRRLQAVAALPGIDGLAVDIEARNVGDVNERNRRLVELSSSLRQSLPGRTIAAIVLPPVVLEVVNPNFWPNFPYHEIARSYDLWMTMGYWTNRKADSGYRDAYRYTRENVERLRAGLGQPDAPVHPIGGIGTSTNAGDVDGYIRAIADTRGIGGSLYDWHTTAAALWPALRGLRSG
ncbi:MAG TPA: hypothetical protein VMZ51_09360 [Acidimicrobiales bacterium]|nr:hypothetical protein [Acidimicrobiales bacterium]